MTHTQNITGGSVSYSVTKQGAPYEHVKSEVTLHFIINPGDDFPTIIRAVSDENVRWAHRALTIVPVAAGEAKAPVVVTAGPEDTKAKAAAADPFAPQAPVAEEKPKTKRTSKKDTVDPAKADPFAPAPSPAPASVTAPVVSHTDPFDAPAPAPVVSSPDPFAVGSDDGVDEDWETVAPPAKPPVTDTELARSLSSVNLSTGKTTEIKDLIRAYSPTCRSVDIPQDQRHAFLADLAKLK